MNIGGAISKAKYFLENNNIKSPGLDCELLMSKVLKKKRSYSSNFNLGFGYKFRFNEWF